MNTLPWLPIAAGPLVGSFLGVVVTRLVRGRTVVWGRSACPHCGHRLNLLELIPILSWLALGGRCRHCSVKISPLYPFLELGCLAIAIGAVLTATGWVVWASCGLGWCLLALAAIDWREGVLPDALTLPLIPTGLAVAYCEDPDALIPHLIGSLAGFVVFAVVRVVYSYLRGREGLGLGDAKLLAAAGAWVSWEGLPSVVLIGSLATLLWVAVEGLLGRHPSLGRALPFGPGLCLGGWIVWLTGPLF